MIWRRVAVLLGLSALAACQQAPALPDRIDYAADAGDHGWSIDRSGNLRFSDVERRGGSALVVTREINVGPQRFVGLVSALAPLVAGHPHCNAVEWDKRTRRLSWTKQGKSEEFSALENCRTGLFDEDTLAAQLARIAYANTIVDGWAKSARVVDWQPASDRQPAS